MAHPVYDKYLETEVLTADPVKLICLLYRAAIEATGAARRHLQAGAIRERSRKITRAMEILIELTRSLDQPRGREISGSLADLYVYMQHLLMEANAKQTDAPLAEVERLLTTLLAAWSALPTPPPPAMVEYVPVSCTG